MNQAALSVAIGLGLGITLGIGIYGAGPDKVSLLRAPAGKQLPPTSEPSQPAPIEPTVSNEDLVRTLENGIGEKGGISIRELGAINQIAEAVRGREAQYLKLIHRVSNSQGGISLNQMMALANGASYEARPRTYDGLSVAPSLADSNPYSGKIPESVLPATNYIPSYESASRRRQRNIDVAPIYNYPSVAGGTGIAIEPRASGRVAPQFGNQNSPPAGAFNPQSGEHYSSAGPGYVSDRDGTYYAPAGPNGVINTRTGAFIPTHP